MTNMNKKFTYSYNQLADELEKAKNGDFDAFTTIYHATVHIQFSIALKIIQNETDAEDIVQELYTLLYKNLNTIKNSITLVSYMNKINYNLCLKYMNREKLRKTVDIADVEHILPDTKTTSNQLMQSISEIELLHVSLSHLNTIERKILRMKYFDEMKIKDIALALNISQRTVNRILKKGISNLKLIHFSLRKKMYSICIFPFLVNIVDFILYTSNSSKKKPNIYSIVTTISNSFEIPKPKFSFSTANLYN
ncbi:MAG: RNA polymerase sigma factor [Anaerorhabdus sp.]|uniref:RNA polymerase sigma factor n=1 Tax=Anaerorhabdus sp. TaxID=1872524 RepID=UPI003A895F0B